MTRIQTLVHPNARGLQLRDPAAAALMGSLARGGADFGADFGDDYAGDDFGDDVAAEIAAEFGDEVGAAVATALAARPAGNAVAQQAWQRANMQRRKSAARAALLDPNAGSTVKVEEYELPMAQQITIGTSAPFTQLTTTPQTTFKPKALVCNAPMPGYAFIQDIKAANVSASVSNFVTDAYNYNANATRSNIKLPKLMPQTTVSVTGSYTGAIPPGVLAGTTTYFTATLYGPSSLAGG